MFHNNDKFLVSTGGYRANENARMELPGSGVNENGVDQRREAFQSMIKDPDNPSPPRWWSVVEITETDVVDGREKKSLSSPSTSAICLRPWTTFSRLLGEH